MRTRTPSSSAPRFPAAQCICGHFAGAHLVVEPLKTGGGFGLVPNGPCATCGESSCARFSPGPRLSP